MMTFERDNFNIPISEIDRLAKMHYDELMDRSDITPFAIGYEKYKALYAKGLCTLISLRIGNLLVGYAVFLTYSHLHAQANKMAQCDAMFIDPEYRKGFVGVRFIRECERILFDNGIDKVTWSVNPKLDWSPILTRSGYKLSSMSYSKYKGD